MSLETNHTSALTPELLSSIAGLTCAGLGQPLGLPAIGLPAIGLPAIGLPAIGLPAIGLPATSLPAACDQGSVTLALQSFILALVANQSAYLISKG
jgi:hypothetical protein